MKTILFDLDGTLLPMDQEVFTKAYFQRMAKYLYPYGYKANDLVQNIWKGFEKMVQNDGKITNEEVFWDVFKEALGEKVIEDKPKFDHFYETDFQLVKDACGYDPNAKLLIDTLKKDHTLILATNPVFPKIATYSRIRWAGLDVNDFKYITTYENSHSCKPNLCYYQEIVDAFQLDPKECIMIGNDVKEDMVARKLGMDVFLVTDCLINSDHEDIDQFAHGSLKDVIKYVKEKENVRGI